MTITDCSAPKTLYQLHKVTLSCNRSSCLISKHTIIESRSPAIMTNTLSLGTFPSILFNCNRSLCCGRKCISHMSCFHLKRRLSYCPSNCTCVEYNILTLNPYGQTLTHTQTNTNHAVCLIPLSCRSME